LAVAGVAVAEGDGVVEDEVFVVPVAHDLRQVGDGEVARRLGAAGVEELVVRVRREAEEAALAPLERLLPALVEPDAAGAAAGHDVDGLVVDVPLGNGLAARGDLDKVLVLLVVAVKVEKSALDALPGQSPTSTCFMSLM
jgi:hypothetical protein